MMDAVQLRAVRSEQWWRARAILGLSLCGLASCSESDAPTPAAPMPPVLRGELTDAVGDASKSASVPVHPDLASATLEVVGGILTITVTYAGGTWSQTRSVWFVVLDMDENSSTGFGDVPASASSPSVETFGWEYQITAVDPAETSTGGITRALGRTSFDRVGTVPVTFPGPNAVRVSIPLSMLGNDDGRLRFRVLAGQWDGPLSAALTDVMPEAGQQAGSVR
jgi:hypothetical protein